MSFRLDNKVAMVTGAARGIGRAAAVALAKAGATVVGIDITGPASAHVDFAPATADELAETGRLVEQAGQRWLAITLDQRNLPLLRDAATQVVTTLGGIDILFANGGIQAFKPILEMEDPDWHDQIDINLTGTMNVVRAFAPHLVKRGGGRIIITSSTQGQHGTKNGSAYAASKWGLIGLMKSAAMEFGEHKITVNALIPGLIDTPLTRHGDRYAQAIETAGKQPSGDEAKDEETARTSLAAKSPL
ncbi:MAG: SDR family NAD(P)-dependent oxidoreductase, partial [Janthinobacterium lividum]